MFLFRCSYREKTKQLVILDLIYTDSSNKRNIALSTLDFLFKSRDVLYAANLFPTSKRRLKTFDVPHLSIFGLRNHLIQLIFLLFLNSYLQSQLLLDNCSNKILYLVNPYHLLLSSKAVRILQQIKSNSLSPSKAKLCFFTNPSQHFWWDNWTTNLPLQSIFLNQEFSVHKNLL